MVRWLRVSWPTSQNLPMRWNDAALVPYVRSLLGLPTEVLHLAAAQVATKRIRVGPKGQLTKQVAVNRYWYIYLEWQRTRARSLGVVRVGGWRPRLNWG